MNFLELVNRARQECGVSGPDLSTVTNRSNRESNRIIDWTASAWNELQLLHPRSWQFLKGSFSFNTVAGQNAYAPSTLQHTYLNSGITIPSTSVSTTSWDDVARGTLRCYPVSVGYGGEMLMNFIPWDNFRDLYLYGNMRTTSQRPVAFALAPDKTVFLGAIPDDVYVINGEYWADPQKLIADTDVPVMPEKFHEIIVYKVMLKYAYNTSAPELVTAGKEGLRTLMAALRIEQLPEINHADSLA